MVAHFDGRKDEDGREYCVYLHINNINHKGYVGLTKCTQNRWLPCKYKDSPYFYKAIQKYGWENFSHEILEKYLTFEEACWFEEEYISYYETNNSKYGYNLTMGGQGCKGVTPSKDHIQKALAGIKRYIEKYGHPMKGKKLTEEQKLTHHEALRSIMIPVCQYTLEGKFISSYESYSEAARAVRGAPTHIYDCIKGKSYTAYGYIWKEDIGDYEDILPLQRPIINNKEVYQISATDKTVIRTYPSARAACIALGHKSFGDVALAARRGTKCGGYYWRYVNDSEI